MILSRLVRGRSTSLASLDTSPEPGEFSIEVPLRILDSLALSFPLLAGISAALGSPLLLGAQVDFPPTQPRLSGRPLIAITTSKYLFSWDSRHPKKSPVQPIWRPWTSRPCARPCHEGCRRWHRPKRDNRWRDREELRPSCVSLCCESRNAMRSIRAISLVKRDLHHVQVLTQLSSLRVTQCTRLVSIDGMNITIQAIWSMMINYAMGLVGSPLISWLEASPVASGPCQDPYQGPSQVAVSRGISP